MRPGKRLERWVPSLAVLAGVAAAMGQAPWSLWLLALPAYALAVWLVAAATTRGQGTLRAWAFGLGHFLMALNWIREPFQVDAARDGWMATPALILLAAGLALFWGVAGWLAHRLPPGRRAFGFALALVALEAARGVVLTGFPWAMPGHIWIGHAPGQLAALAGAGGLTLLTLGLAALPAAYGWRGAGLAAMLLALVWGWGWQRAAAPLPPAPGQVVRLVQPNADQSLKWQPEHARTFFNRHLKLSGAAPAGPAPDLIVWPETAVPFLLDDPGWGLQAIVDVAGATPVALGIQRTAGMRGFNSLAVIGRDAAGGPEIRATYDKHQLVPFGEYTPGGDLLADWLGVFSFSPAEGNGYSAGPGPAVLDLPGFGPVQPLICYEAVFPWFQRAVPRPEWLLQVTNDAWFGAESGPWQHLALARLRAIESGLPLLRAANTGVSAVIDARGGIGASLGMKQMGFLDAALPGALPPTPYARFGIWPAVLLWGFAALLLLYRRPNAN